MKVNYEELAKSFEACDIDASDFSHADHVGVAYEMLRRYAFLDASVQILQQHQDYRHCRGCSTKIQHHYHPGLSQPYR